MKIKIKKEDLRKNRIISKNKPKVENNKKPYKRDKHIEVVDFNFIDTNSYK